MRPLVPGDLKALTGLALAFNDEDGHPLSRGGRAALNLLCHGTPHGVGFMIERERRDVGYLVIGLGFSVEFGGIDAFSDEFYIEPQFRGSGAGTAALKELGKIARWMKIKALHLEAMPGNDRAAAWVQVVGPAADVKAA